MVWHLKLVQRQLEQVKPGAVAETGGNDSETANTGSVVGVEATGVAVVGVG